MKKVLLIIFLLSIYGCKISKEKQKKKDDKKSLMRKLSEFTSDELYKYCLRHKKFC